VKPGPPIGVATALVSLCVLAALAHAASYGHVTSDDAFISLRYAQNFAEGQGLVFNPTGERVEGFSNPLFTLVCAALLRVGVAPLVAAKLVGLVSWGFVVLVCARFAAGVSGSGALAGAVAALLLAGSTFPAVWAVAGLETILHALLVTLAVSVAGRECESGRIRWSPIAFLAVAASRPEGALLAAVAAAVMLFRLRADAVAVVQSWTVRFALPAGLLVAARYAYFDAFVPNTFGAKVFFGAETALYGLAYIAEFARDGGFWIGVPALAGIGIICTADSRTRTLGMVAIAVVVAQLAFVVLVGGDAMLAYRFLMPIYPLLVAFAAVAIVRLLARFGAMTAVAAALVVALACGVTQAKALERSSRRYWLAHERPGAAHLFDTDLTGTWLQSHMDSALFIRERSKPGDVLVVTEAGVLPFVTRLETVDLLGLNDRAIAVMWRKAAAEERESELAGLPPLRQWAYDIASSAYAREPHWIVLDGHFEPGSGEFVPRLGIGNWVISHAKFADYREVFRAPVYDGEQTRLGRDRVNVVFERSSGESDD
jgi:arabinofuranosyltransferase